MSKLLRSYFYWTYPRGNIHYDVMVTLILLFIFVTPQFWDFGDKPSRAPGPSHPIQVASDGSRSLLVTISDIDVRHHPTHPIARCAVSSAKPSSRSPAMPSPSSAGKPPWTQTATRSGEFGPAADRLREAVHARHLTCPQGLEASAHDLVAPHGSIDVTSSVTPEDKV